MIMPMLFPCLIFFTPSPSKDSTHSLHAISDQLATDPVTNGRSSVPVLAFKCGLYCLSNSPAHSQCMECFGLTYSWLPALGKSTLIFCGRRSKQSIEAYLNTKHVNVAHCVKQRNLFFIYVGQVFIVVFLIILFLINTKYFFG